MASAADFLACADQELRMDPRELPSILSPLRNGEADLVSGSRQRLSRRGFYDLAVQWRWLAGEALIRWITGSTLRDHRSGVVAIAAVAARGLAPHVRNTREFFEMELMLLAQWQGWRVREFPLLPLVPSRVRPVMPGEFARVLRSLWCRRKRRLR